MDFMWGQGGQGGDGWQGVWELGPAGGRGVGNGGSVAKLRAPTTN